MKEFYVYILTNANRTALYVGVTGNLEKRLNEHSSGEKGESAFTGRYGIKYLIHCERFMSATEAIAREKEIKGWRREKKTRLIETMNPAWKFLNESDFI